MWGRFHQICAERWRDMFPWKQLLLTYQKKMFHLPFTTLTFSKKTKTTWSESQTFSETGRHTASQVQLQRLWTLQWLTIEEMISLVPTLCLSNHRPHPHLWAWPPLWCQRWLVQKSPGSQLRTDWLQPENTNTHKQSYCSHECIRSPTNQNDQWWHKNPVWYRWTWNIWNWVIHQTQSEIFESISDRVIWVNIKHSCDTKQGWGQVISGRLPACAPMRMADCIWAWSGRSLSHSASEDCRHRKYIHITKKIYTIWIKHMMRVNKTADHVR